MSQTIKLRRGDKVELDAINLAEGEVGFTEDTQELWVGTGTEHRLIGKTIVGTLAQRPSHGIAGRTFYATDTDQFFLDRGNEYTEIAEDVTNNYDNRYVNQDGDIMTGMLESDGFSTANDGDHCFIANPKGGFFSTDSSNHTGAIKLLLPVSWTNDMVSMTVKIYNYSTGSSMMLELGGYNYSVGAQWNNTFATVLRSDIDNGITPTVRFGYDSSAGKCAVWIGDPTTGWLYPQVQVMNFMGGYHSILANWKEGWNISIDSTAATNVNRTITATDSLPVTHWDNIVALPTGTHWTSNNQGHNTGMDADTVDNIHGSELQLRSEKGAANGYAGLDGSGLVPSTQLPSYVDDVMEFANLAAFPTTGETGKIYVALDDDKQYRWSGSLYIYISVGDVTSVAGRKGAVDIYVDDISDFDTEVTGNTTVVANTNARHTHSNKAILDATTASFLTGDESKLDGIESSATRDQTKADIDALNIDADTLDSLDSTSFARADMGGTLGAVDAYQYWRRGYSVSNTVILPLLQENGTALFNGGVYRFTGHVTNTEADTSSRAVFWNKNGVWSVNVTGQYGTSGNNVEFLISSGVPSVKTPHANLYDVYVYHERMILGEPNSGVDNLQYAFGTDGYVSNVANVLKFKHSDGSLHTIWHENNDGIGTGLNADLLDDHHAGDFVSRTTTGEPLSFSNQCLVYNYSDVNNIDHIWYDDALNCFTFCANTALKSPASADIACNTIQSGAINTEGNINLGGAATTTESRSLQIGNGRTGNGYAFIDLIGDTTYSDYGLRIRRENDGPNSRTDIIHRGTNSLRMNTMEYATFEIFTNNVQRARFTGGGYFYLQYGNNGINEFSTDGTMSGNSDNAVPTEKATKAYVDYKAGESLAMTIALG